MNRLKAVKAVLAEKHGFEFEKPFRPIRDEELARVVELEELADLLETVSSKLEEKSAPATKTPAKPNLVAKDEE